MGKKYDKKFNSARNIQKEQELTVSNTEKENRSFKSIKNPGDIIQKYLILLQK